MDSNIIDIKIKGTKVLELKSKGEWISRIPRHLPEKISADQFLFVDKNGNLLTIGLDFRYAEEYGTYPVTVYLAQRTLVAVDQKGKEVKDVL